MIIVIVIIVIIVVIIIINECSPLGNEGGGARTCTQEVRFSQNPYQTISANPVCVVQKGRV